MRKRSTFWIPVALGLLLAWPLSVRAQPPEPSLRHFFLDEAVTLGLAQNPRLARSAQAVREAEGRYLAVASQKNSRVVFNSSTQASSKQVDFVFRPDPVISQMSLAVQTLLTTFGKIENEISAAFLRIDAAALEYEVVRQDLVLAIKQAFFEVLRAESALQVGGENLRLARLTLQDTLALFDQGVMARYDLVQAELQVVEAEQALAQSKTTREQAMVALRTVLFDPDRQAPAVPLPPRPLEIGDRWTTGQLLELARQHRPELAVLQKNLEVAERLLESARSQGRPNLTLSTGYATSLGNPILLQDNLFLSLNVQWALWDGGEGSAAIAVAQAQQQALKHQMEEVRAEIEREVEQVWLELCQTEFTLATAQKRRSAAQVFYDMARDRYRVGLGTTLELQTALQGLIVARQAQVVAFYDRELTYARLERSLGREFGRTFVAPEPEKGSHP